MVAFLLLASSRFPSNRAAASDSPLPAPAGSRMWHVGAWGALEISTLTISPPFEMIPDDWGRPTGSGDRWYLPGVTASVAAQFLDAAGLASDQVDGLMRSVREDPAIKGIVLSPSKDLVRNLPSDVRARLYLQLGKSELNVSQAQPFRCREDSVEAWLGGSSLAPATRRLVDSLVYRDDHYLYFADTELVLSLVTDRDELRRLAKALLRQKATRLRLSVPSLADVGRVTAYWGRGGRRTDIQPLLESIAGADRDDGIDIVHLLPTFARTNLYRYPRLTAEDLNRPQLANCLWTALNFFNETPDDRLLDPKTALDHLQRDYYLVHDNFELGDIVAFLDERGRLFHAAVYISDDFVFTKNGFSAMSPWVILPLEDVLDYYRIVVEKPRLLYHRRKGF